MKFLGSVLLVFLIGSSSAQTQGLNETRKIEKRASWETSGVIVRSEKPIYLPTHIYISHGMFDPARVKPVEDYGKRVVFEAQRIFAWHNIKMEIIELTEFKEGDPFPVGNSLTQTLPAFREYLRTNAANRLDVHVLLVDFESDESNVGLATLNSICTSSASAVVQTGSRIGYNIFKNAQALAHEIGHILGLLHVAPNEPDCLCADESGYKCVMHEETFGWNKSIPTSFHSCSIKSLLENVPLCLHSYSRGENMLKECGNGIVDEGEECDCGFEESCKVGGVDNCCDSSTCKFKDPSMQCAEGECCQNCQFIMGKKCGVSTNDCDLVDYCDGTRADCFDSWAMHGTSCEGGKGNCFKGSCSTPDNACSHLFPKSKVKYSEYCKLVINSVAKNGKCNDGMKNKELEFAVCSSGAPYCGQLWCELTEGSMHDPFYSLTINSDRICYTLLDSTSPLSKMTDTTPCGRNKYCIGYHCLDDGFYPKSCPTPCPEHTVCNHMGKCVPSDERYFTDFPINTRLSDLTQKVKNLFNFIQNQTAKPVPIPES